MVTNLVIGRPLILQTLAIRPLSSPSIRKHVTFPETPRLVIPHLAELRWPGRAKSSDMLSKFPLPRKTSNRRNLSLPIPNETRPSPTNPTNVTPSSSFQSLPKTTAKMLRTSATKVLRNGMVRSSTVVPLTRAASTTHAISNPTLANIEKRWEGMPLQEQADLWMALRDRMKGEWTELTIQEQKAGACFTQFFSVLITPWIRPVLVSKHCGKESIPLYDSWTRHWL